MSSAPLARRRAWLAAAAAMAVLALDLARPPERQWLARAELAALAAYQATLSPLAARSGVRCRFEPTCSRYAAESIRRRGALVGTARAAWRVARCGPWTRAGTHDPP